MPTQKSKRLPRRPVAASILSVALGLSIALAGCATAPPPAPKVGTWNGRPLGAPPSPNPAIKKRMLSLASSQWDLFGRQTVVFSGSEESIPHVGYWEDDDAMRSGQVNLYWQAVGKPGITGMDCRQPWSAAFMSWVMQGAGVPSSQFRPAPAHWIYLSDLVDEADFPGRWFVPRRPSDYSPQPGDLICASRSGSHPTTYGGYCTSASLQGTETHCDLVVAKNGRTLESIGGNVRNSVSRSRVELDANGHLQSVPRRPWFLVLQNRL